MSLYRDSAVVLRTYKMGEADRIVSDLTEVTWPIAGWPIAG